MVVRIVRAGLPVGPAIRTVGQEANPPLNSIFAKIADQIEIGVPLDDAMGRTSEVVGNPDFRFSPLPLRCSSRPAAGTPPVQPCRCS